MTDTIMLEAPARGGRISDLADGQGRILRLHDIMARIPMDLRARYR